MPHNQFLIKKVSGGFANAKGGKLWGPKSNLKLDGLKLSNCETWGDKIKQLELRGPKSHIYKTWRTRTAFKPKNNN
jgi:hypothetical protein